MAEFVLTLWMVLFLAAAGAALWTEIREHGRDRSREAGAIALLALVPIAAGTTGVAEVRTVSWLVIGVWGLLNGILEVGDGRTARALLWGLVGTGSLLLGTLTLVGL